MNLYYNKSRRSTVSRKAARAKYDRDTVHAILDEGLVAHVGIVDDGRPVVIPVLYARRGDELLLHGSPRSRLLEVAAAGGDMCVEVTLLDGVVFARSAFHHSMNYRSVVAFGRGRTIDDPDEKEAALRALVEHVAPGRSRDARGPNAKELGSTMVVAMAIDEASAKVRSGPPVDVTADLGLPVWAGVLPLGMSAGDAETADGCEHDAPGYVRAYARASGRVSREPVSLMRTDVAHRG